MEERRTEEVSSFAWGRHQDCPRLPLLTLPGVASMASLRSPRFLPRLVRAPALGGGEENKCLNVPGFGLWSWHPHGPCQRGQMRKGLLWGLRR